MLAMPEACGIQLATLPLVEVDEYEADFKEAYEYYREIREQSEILLRNRRESQLEPVWSSDYDLARFLNEQARDNCWIPVRAREPGSR